MKINLYKLMSYAERPMPPFPDEYSSEWYEECLLIDMARELLYYRLKEEKDKEEKKDVEHREEG